jgi:hypothetical protein
MVISFLVNVFLGAPPSFSAVQLFTGKDQLCLPGRIPCSLREFRASVVRLFFF